MADKPGTGGASAASDTDKDDALDTAFALEGDLDVVMLDDEADFYEPSNPLRGQNEAEANGSALDGASPADLDDARFQERLSQERRLREDGEKQALETQERTEAALLAAEKRNISVQKDSFKLALDGVDVRIRTATEALIYARQENDVSAETNIEQQLNELRNIRSQINTNMERLPDERSLDQEFEQHIRTRRAKFAAKAGTSDDPKPLNAKAEQWTKANSWMGDSSRAKEKAALIETNNGLVAEGYDANTDDFFTELSRRMAKRFPSLNVRNFNGQGAGQQPAPKPSHQQRTAPPVAPARSSAPPSPQTAKLKGRVELNHSDVAMMKMLRIDPSNKEAVKRYAAEKYRRVSSEQRR